MERRTRLKQWHHNQNTTNRKPKGDFLSQKLAKRLSKIKKITRNPGINVFRMHELCCCRTFYITFKLMQQVFYYGRKTSNILLFCPYRVFHYYISQLIDILTAEAGKPWICTLASHSNAETTTKAHCVKKSNDLFCAVSLANWSIWIYPFGIILDVPMLV